MRIFFSKESGTVDRLVIPAACVHCIIIKYNELLVLIFINPMGFREVCILKTLFLIIK